ARAGGAPFRGPAPPGQLDLPQGADRAAPRAGGGRDRRARPAGGGAGAGAVPAHRLRPDAPAAGRGRPRVGTGPHRAHAPERLRSGLGASRSRGQYAQYGPVPWGVLWPSIPMNTLRPKKNGIPQSKSPSSVPARSLRAALLVAKSVSALATLNDTG